MPYVKRNEQNKIVGLYARKQEFASEFLPEENLEVVYYKELPPLEKKKAEITAERYRKETSGVRINGNHYATDDRSKILIPGVSDLADNSEDPDVVRPFKTADSNGIAVYHELPVWEAIQVKRIGGEYIQKCFDEERRLLKGLENNEELVPNWPTQEYTITREEALERRLTRGQLQEKVRTLENKEHLHYEVLTGTTDANGSVVFTFNVEEIDIVPKVTWKGNQVVLPYIKESTATTVTLGAKQSRDSLVLSSGPFQEAPQGTVISVAVIGKV